MGLLSILMLPAQAAALLVVPSLVTNLWQIFGPGFYALVRRIATMLLGVCVGTWFGSGWRWEPSVTGGVWYDFTGNNVATLTSNGFVTDLTDNATHRTTGEVGGMLNAFQVGSGWSAFVKGNYRFASGFSSGLVTGGFRYQWGTWPVAWGGH